jgi:hypothetical protein
MYEAEIARGVAVLDRHGPANWRRRINVSRLDLKKVCDCVLGQVYRGTGGLSPFEVGATVLYAATHGLNANRLMREVYVGDGGIDRKVGIWAEDHGFFRRSTYGYPTLTDEWQQELRRQRTTHDRFDLRYVLRVGLRRPTRERTSV